MTLKEIPLDQIKPPEQPQRLTLTLAPDLELVSSIKARGLLQPISVTESGGQYNIVYGHRRFLACQAAGHAVIRALIISRDDQEKALDRIHENLYRRDPNPIEEGYYFLLLQEREDWTHEQIAQEIGKARSYVTERIQLASEVTEVTEALAQGQITFTQARELRKVKNPARRKAWTKVAKDEGMRPDFIRRARQDYEDLDEAGEAAPPSSDHGQELASPPRIMETCYLCGGEDEIEKMVSRPVHPACYNTVQDATKRAAANQD